MSTYTLYCDQAKNIVLHLAPAELIKTDSNDFSYLLYILLSKRKVLEHPKANKYIKMTKEELIELTNKIRAEYGQPEYEMNAPVNESAKRLTTLRMQYAQEKAKEARLKAKADGQDQKPEGLKDLNEVLKDKPKLEAASLPYFCTDKDLVPFTDEERRVVIAKLENWKLTDNQISIKTHVNRQAVTALFRSMAWKLLSNRIGDETLKIEVLANLRHHARSDSKINMRLAEHYGFIKPEKTEIEINKPIDDPEAIKMLKEIGDKLSEPKLSEPNSEANNKDSKDNKDSKEA